jgi:hypothetical protein
MPDKIGKHLLGWKKPDPSVRANDYRMAYFLGKKQDFTALDEALAKIDASPGVAPGTKAGFHAFADFLKGAQPSPTPTPTPTVKDWPDAHQLDQGNTGHCVGFGGAQFHNADPVAGDYTDDDGHKLYYECKVLDGEPKAEDGSYVHTLAKALVNRGLIKTYVWAHTVSEIQQWILQNGPVVVGTDWYNDMFEPDKDGLVKPTGGVAGGHCFLANGYDPTKDELHFQNSWGSNWGLNGYFKMKSADFKKLLDANGEAMSAAELG